MNNSKIFKIAFPQPLSRGTILSLSLLATPTLQKKTSIGSRRKENIYWNQPESKINTGIRGEK